MPYTVIVRFTTPEQATMPTDPEILMTQAGNIMLTPGQIVAAIGDDLLRRNSDPWQRDERGKVVGRQAAPTLSKEAIDQALNEAWTLDPGTANQTLLVGKIEKYESRVRLADGQAPDFLRHNQQHGPNAGQNAIAAYIARLTGIPCSYTPPANTVRLLGASVPLTKIQTALSGLLRPALTPFDMKILVDAIGNEDADLIARYLVPNDWPNESWRLPPIDLAYILIHGGHRALLDRTRVA